MLCICCCCCCCCTFIQQGLAKFYRCNTQDEGKMLCICCCCCCTLTQPGSYYQSRRRANALPLGVATVTWTTIPSLNITIHNTWVKIHCSHRYNTAWNTLYIARIDTLQHDFARIGTLQHDNLLRRLTILQDNLLFHSPFVTNNSDQRHFKLIRFSP